MQIPIPPGETIKELMETKRIGFLEMSERLEISLMELKSLLNGFNRIDENLASKLEEILGPSQSFWLRLEAIFREKLSKMS